MLQLFGSFCLQIGAGAAHPPPPPPTPPPLMPSMLHVLMVFTIPYHFYTSGFIPFIVFLFFFSVIFLLIFFIMFYHFHYCSLRIIICHHCSSVLKTVHHFLHLSSLRIIFRVRSSLFIRFHHVPSSVLNRSSCSIVVSIMFLPFPLFFIKFIICLSCSIYFLCFHHVLSCFYHCHHVTSSFSIIFTIFISFSPFLYHVHHCYIILLIVKSFSLIFPRFIRDFSSILTAFASESRSRVRRLSILGPQPNKKAPKKTAQRKLHT